MGYSEPILHGLCSLGFSTRHVLHTYAAGNSDLFKAIKVSFYCSIKYNYLHSMNRKIEIVIYHELWIDRTFNSSYRIWFNLTPQSLVCYLILMCTQLKIFSWNLYVVFHNLKFNINSFISCILKCSLNFYVETHVKPANHVVPTWKFAAFQVEFQVEI